MKRNFSLILTVLSAFFFPGRAMAESNTQPLPETPEQRDARMAWWRDARFGMFIHWGVYSVPAGEWQGKTNYGEWFMEETKMPVSQYEKFAQQFNPLQFNALDWVRMAKNAGMKYIVITSKHHDGFGIFHSDLTDWCMKSTPFPRDPLQELAQACQQEGIRLCFYHSIMDWHHPGWGTRRPWNDKATGQPDMDAYVAFMKGQLKELLTRYGPIGVLWFDGEWESAWTHERGMDLYNYVRRLQPDIIVNNRVGKGRAGMSGMDKGKGVGDFGTPEQEIPPTGFGPGVDWESCMTMNNHWGYNKHDQNWKSTKTLVRNLIDCASKGGNYLLNVGPTSQGLFPEASIQRLAEIGRWMKVNHPAIYGTTASPFKKLGWGRATRKENTLYLHVYDWPAEGPLLAPVTTKVKRAYLLAQPDRDLKTSTSPQGIHIQLPPFPPDLVATVIAVETEGPLQVVDTQPEQRADGLVRLLAQDAEIVGSTARLEGEKEPNIGYWTDAKDSVQWAIRITQPGVFVAQINYACEPSSAGSEYLLQIGDQSLKGQVKATSGWTDYQVVELGTIAIEKPGKTIITLKPVSKPGQAVMNLRSVTLTPRK